MNAELLTLIIVVFGLLADMIIGVYNPLSGAVIVNFFIVLLLEFFSDPT